MCDDDTDLNLEETMDRGDGGPAFPGSYVGENAPHEGIGGGMSLRDYFATAAMQGIVERLGLEHLVGKHKGEIGILSFEVADAMLATRGIRDAELARARRTRRGE